MPWMFKEVLAPPASVDQTSTWSPVAAPLSSMAQLSAGMLPLRDEGYGPRTPLPPPALGTPVKKEPQETAPGPSHSTHQGPEVSPISSGDEVPELVSNVDVSGAIHLVSSPFQTEPVPRDGHCTKRHKNE